MAVASNVSKERLFLFLTIAVAVCSDASALVSEFMHSFGLNYECPSGWSEWSGCLSTETRNVIRSLPRTCRASAAGAMMRRANGVINAIVNYYNSMNATARPCGMCLKQIQCSNECVNPTPEVIRLTKPFGIREQFCSNVDQSYACAFVNRLNVDLTTGVCNVWPPKEDILPALVPHKIRSQIYNTPLLNCISIERKCYCCCHPFRPDPCTAKCLMRPCTELKVITNSLYNRHLG